jgi:uncharacterized membrane protein YozB (DUF420 family)
MGGFFPAASPVYSDIVLIVEIAIGITLFAGMFIGRRGQVRAHKYIQTSMVLVNVPFVLAWMVPEYLTYVLPGIPQELGQLYYLFPTLMLVAGATAEILGIYIILVAGTNVLPERLRFRNYKRWMRTELAIWWLVLILGFSTYYTWYVPH